MPRFLWAWPSALMLVLSLASNLAAATIRVPADETTVQAAIDQCAHGDTVLVAPGTYTGDGNRDLDFGGTNLVLVSEAGPASTTIDIAGTASDPHRGFHFHTGESPGAVVEGFTIRNGRLTDPDAGGGAILCIDASPTIRDCRFIQNAVNADILPPGAAGGAISVQGGAPSIESCHFEDNGAAFGGAIYAAAAAVQLTGCRITNNIATSFGAAFVSHGVAGGTIETCVIDGNFGGLATIVVSSPLTIRSSTLYGNMPDSFEGIVRLGSDAALDLENTIIAFNPSAAVFCEDFNPDLAVSCCDVFGNAADYAFCLEGLLGADGNISEDPLFCDPAQGNFGLHSDSPCVGGGCGLIGALPVACGSTAIRNRHAPALQPRLVARPNPVHLRVELVVTGVVPRSLLGIYDPQGRRVDVLRTNASGVIIWTPRSGAPAGVYLARLEGREVSASTKFVLVK